MKQFHTLRELVDYIPNCVVCGKIMLFSIEGLGFNKEVYIKLSLKDSILRSKSIQSSLSINVDTNEIIDGGTFLNALYNDTIKVIKKCRTCNFTIMSGSQKESRKTNEFPILHLLTEELIFTGKKADLITVYKYHNSMRDGKASIFSQGKFLPQMPFDFAKFTNLKQIVRRIKTLKVFH